MVCIEGIDRTIPSAPLLGWPAAFLGHTTELGRLGREHLQHRAASAPICFCTISSTRLSRICSRWHRICCSNGTPGGGGGTGYTT